MTYDIGLSLRILASVACLHILSNAKLQSYDGQEMRATKELTLLKDSVDEAASFLNLLANEKRLLILCELFENGEMSVGEIVDVADLSQSAVSQHLARLRAERLVKTRRVSQTIYYRLARDPRIRRMLVLLKQLFCE